MPSLTPAHLDHRRLWRGFDYCYPVISRRSKGLSLGVNLNKNRACSFNCVYCEVDRKGPLGRSDIDLGQLEGEMGALLGMAVSEELFNDHPFSAAPQEARRLNDLAFSGDGEPTAAAEFPEAVNRLARLKKEFDLPDVKLVLITNATKLQAPGVAGGIDALMANNGEIWAKLDAGSEDYYRAINRSATPLDQVLANLEFAGKKWPLVIQTLFLEWGDSPPSGQELRQYIDRLKHLLGCGTQIKGLHIYTTARPAPEMAAKPLPKTVLDGLASDVAKALPEIPLEVFYGSLGPGGY